MFPRLVVVLIQWVEREKHEVFLCTTSMYQYSLASMWIAVQVLDLKGCLPESNPSKKHNFQLPLI
jgi:hypothetical protein